MKSIAGGVRSKKISLVNGWKSAATCSALFMMMLSFSDFN